MENVRCLQLIALKNVLVEPPDEDFRWRQICRWYSKTFATPLHEVENLPKIDVLQHYIEEQYENLEDPQVQQELDRLLQREEAVAEAIDKAKEDAAMDQLLAETQAENAIPKKPSKDKDKPLEKVELPEGLLDSMDGLGQAITNIRKALEEPPSSFDLDFSDLEHFPSSP